MKTLSLSNLIYKQNINTKESFSGTMYTTEIVAIIICVFVISSLSTITKTVAQYENNITARVINNTVMSSTGAIINYADEDNGLNAGSKAAQVNVTGNYSFSDCMNSPIHNIKDIQAFCNGFMIGFNSGKCKQMRAQEEQLRSNMTQEDNATQRLLDIGDFGQRLHQYNSQCVPPQSDKIYWAWR